MHRCLNRIKSSIIYARAGTRVYYHDVQTVQFEAPERSLAEAARMVGLLGGPLRMIFAAGDFCFHYPQWYLNATYNQLNQTTVGRVPSPLPMPVMRGDIYSIFCGPIKVMRGNRSEGVGNGGHTSWKINIHRTGLGSPAETGARRFPAGT